MLNAYDQSVGLFIRGLTNLGRQLAKAEEHAAASDSNEAAFLGARIAASPRGPNDASFAPRDVHLYSLADQVHWAAEGARLAVAHLLGARAVPEASDARSFATLHRRIDATISYLREVAPGEIEAGLERTIVIEHPRGSISATGSQFLLAFAIPHFFYHLTTAYGIFRNQGVQLTMGDFLGNWAAS
ncbi:MAG: DUF1993 family protein [Dehalococcoidia bacterium]